MAWKWWKIQATSETLLNDVPDQTVDFTLDGLGDVTIRFIRGFDDAVGIIFKDFLLFPNLNGRNPFTQNEVVGAMIQDGYYWVGVDESIL